MLQEQAGWVVGAYKAKQSVCYFREAPRARLESVKRFDSALAKRTVA